jgi:hypothetical protein
LGILPAAFFTAAKDGPQNCVQGTLSPVAPNARYQVDPNSLSCVFAQCRASHFVCAKEKFWNACAERAFESIAGAREAAMTIYADLARRYFCRTEYRLRVASRSYGRNRKVDFPAAALGRIHGSRKGPNGKRAKAYRVAR